MAEDVKTPSKDKRPKVSAKITEEKSSSSKTGSMVIINELGADNKSKSKQIHVNLELDVSIDANIVLSVKRKPKKDTNRTESQPKSIQASATYEDDDEDVIPNSNENTPVAKVRKFASKHGTPKKTTRKSPRSAL